MASSPIWIAERDVVTLLNLPSAIDALEAGLAAEARGEVENMVKTHVAWGAGSTLHAIGASFPGAGVVGTKTWAHTSGGATPLVILFDSIDGSLKAVIEAFAMGQLRTGGITGVATRWLSAPGADELCMIGTGKQAITQVAAVVAVRPIRRVRVFGRNPERRSGLAERVREVFDLEVIEADRCRHAAEGAPIVNLATRATEPILSSAMVGAGAHVNSIGAIVPSRAELHGDLLQRAERIAVDSKPQAQKLSRELIDFCGSGPGNWDQVEKLADIVAGRRKRGSGVDLTVFKSLGMGISDVAVAVRVYGQALKRGVGRPIPHPERVTPPRQTLIGSPGGQLLKFSEEE